MYDARIHALRALANLGHRTPAFFVKEAFALPESAGELEAREVATHVLRHPGSHRTIAVLRELLRAPERVVDGGDEWDFEELL
jgi:hypothetical protein